MGYGARARRVPALGGAVLGDVDIYKVALLCKCERGFSGIVAKEIYSMNDFEPKCGSFNPSYYGAYVAQSFFDELEKSITCEMKVLNYVDVSAAQAAYIILDQAGSPIKIFDIKAGRKNVSDLSAFGNKIGIKITQIDAITMKMTADISASATVAYLDSVDNLQPGYYVKFYNGTLTEVKVILTVVPSTKAITFSATTNAFTAALTTVTRLDWRLDVYVKDSIGGYQKKEQWQGPFAKSNTIGLAADVNNEETGSDYVILAVNAANASAPESQRPAPLTTETPFTAGSDGAAPTDAQWKTLAETYLSSEEFTILLAPESATTVHAQNMVDFCTSGYKGMYYAQAANAATETTLKNFGALCRGGIKFGMLPSDKWIRVNDPTVLGGLKDIPR